MRLLVSVRDAGEAAAALAGGADLIDAKDPTRGALGAVTPDAFAAIVATVRNARPVTAALGDAAEATTEADVEALACAFAAAGATLVKLGFAGEQDPARVTALLRAAVRGAAHGGAGVIAAAYADAAHVGAIAHAHVLSCAVAAGVRGVLLDTADKDGPGLTALLAPDALGEWVQAAQAASLLVTLAGRLRADDLDAVRAAGADVVGVRGAACIGGRTGGVDAARVRALRARLTDTSARASSDVLAAAQR